MKNFSHFTLFLFLAITLSGCELIGDIFGAGFYTGIFAVVVVIVILVVIIARFRKRG